MKKIILNQIDNSIFNLQMLKDNDVIGNMTVYPYMRDIDGILNLYIEEKWRCKWLSKSFGKFAFQMLIKTCKDFGIQVLMTRLDNPKSLRLLDFFGFNKYNDKYYYILI
jgi:hypothetical protein